MNEQPFTCILTAAASYQLGDPILVKFEIRNTTEKIYQLLIWGTPLERQPLHFLSVQREREILRYDGFRVMRGDPTEDAYVLLAPNESLSNEVDISRLYPLDRPGVYVATLDLYLHDVFPVPELTKQPARRLDDHEPHALDPTTIEFEVVPGGQPRLTFGQTARQQQRDEPAVTATGDGAPEPKFSGGTDIEQNSTFVAHFNAQLFTAMAARTLKVPNLIPDTQTREIYEEWFGEFDQGRYKTVTDGFSAMSKVLDTKQVTYEFDGPACQTDWVAYTFYKCTTVFLCALFVPLPQFASFDVSKYGVLIHEWSHSVNDTEDCTYGEGPCLQLAKTHPDIAVKNADNYRLFAVDIAQGQLINSVPDTTTAAPAACAFKDKLFVFWKANANNGIVSSSSSNGQTWAPGQFIRSDITTSTAPAACVFNKQLYVFWTDVETQLINFSLSADGSSWSDQQAINSINADSSGAAPAACVFGQSLYLFWQSAEWGILNQIFFSASTDGKTWPPGKTINADPAKTAFAPAACVFDGGLYVFWKAFSSSSTAIIFARSEDGKTWPSGTGIANDQNTSDSPAACAIDGRLFVFWRGLDNHILSAQSKAGNGWPVSNPISEFPDSTSAAVAVSVFNGQPYVFWKSEDESNRIFLL